MENEKEDYRNYEYSAADAAKSVKLKNLYINPGWGVTANLYRDEDNHIFVFWHWMTSHGIGFDHRSCVVESLEELRKALLQDADSWVSREDVDRICSECEDFFKQKR